MTDNEIIKALECCIGYHECSKCPYNSGAAGTSECMSECMSDTRHLIKSQKAEIDTYQKHIDNDIIYANAIKAEAIKDFAERLKENEFFANFTYKGEARLIIDNLVKEMIGEQ